MSYVLKWCTILLYQWYRQNRELKRRSQIMAQKFLHSDPDESLHLDVSDEVDTNFDDLDQLRQMVKGQCD